jgi:hypothetical protein
MTRVYIFDEDDSPQRFALALLFGRLQNSGLRSTDALWSVTRARGYGERIAHLESLLDDADVVEVGEQELGELLQGRDEWFYELDVRNSDGSIRFGLLDSSAMFLDASEDVRVTAVEGFGDVRSSDVGAHSDPQGH